MGIRYLKINLDKSSGAQSEDQKVLSPENQTKYSIIMLKVSKQFLVPQLTADVITYR